MLCVSRFQLSDVHRCGVLICLAGDRVHLFLVSVFMLFNGNLM